MMRMADDIDQLIDWAERNHWVVKTDASGYRRFYAPGGQYVGRFPATPSNPRQRLRDIVKAVRRHGLDRPAPGKKEQRSQRRQEGH